MYHTSLVFMLSSCIVFIHAAPTDTIYGQQLQHTAALLKGVWVNELGSTLNITNVFRPSMQIKGHYVSPMGTTGDNYPLAGFVNLAPKVSGKHNVIVISFSVRWSNIGSVTTWTGYYDNDDNKIIGQWLLVRPVTNLKYEHILTGQDRFTKQT